MSSWLIGLIITFFVIYFFFGSQNLDDEEEDLEYLHSWKDGNGFTTKVIQIGHDKIVVENFSRKRGRKVRVWTVEECAKDAGWSVEKMRDHLGLPDESALKEVEMTLGEWLHEKNQHQR